MAKTFRKREKRSDLKNLPARVKLRLLGLALLTVVALVLVVRITAFVNSIARTKLSDEGLIHGESYSGMEVIHGIDVSEFQDRIKWKKVKSGRADFVFVRAGYRSGESGELVTDADFRSNIKKANKAGLMAGAYFFSQAINEEEAEEEAEYLLDLVSRYDIDMPLVIDYEATEGGRLQQAIEAGELPYASAYHDIVLAFCDRVERAGYESAVYANYDMLTNYMDSSILCDEATVWAAQYGGECTVAGDYMYWQCSDEASVSGVNGYIDHDIWYMEPGRVYSTRAAGISDAVSIGECEIEFSDKSYSLTNHRAVPDVTVTYEGKKLRQGRDYRISFVKNAEKGTGYAIVRGISNYKDWTSVPFTID